MKLIADIATKTWSRVDEENQSRFGNFFFGFRNNEQLPVSFNEMRFGYTLANSDGVINEDRSPLEGISYVSSDENYLYSNTVNDLVPDEEYVLSVWAENAGERWEEEFSFTIPRPESPYPSWIYDDETHSWNAPVAYPENGGTYFWNENIGEWEEIQGNV